MNQELISIVIPAYNPPIENFKKCLNSILSQTYKVIEVIVVDDGSTQEVSKKMDEFSSFDYRIKVIHQPNKGEGGARNTGIEVSEGKYIIFVDADDGLAPGWIKYSYELIKKYNADIVAGSVVRVQKIPSKVEVADFNIMHKYFDKTLFNFLQRDFLYFNSKLVDNLNILDPGVCSKLIRKATINELRFPIGIKLSSDQVFNHQLLSNAKSYVLSNDISYYYVENFNSISHVYQPKAVDYMMQSMNLIKQYIIDDEEVKQAYYYRVLAEITQAIQYAYFSDKHIIKFSEKCFGIKYAMNQELVKYAMKEVKYNTLPSKQWKLKACLFKNKYYHIYCIFKILTDIFE